MYQDPEYKAYRHTTYKDMNHKQSRQYDSHIKDRTGKKTAWQQYQKLDKINASGEEYPDQEEGQKQNAESPQGKKQKQKQDAPCLDEGRSSCTRETEQGPRQTTMATKVSDQVKEWRQRQRQEGDL